MVWPGNCKFSLRWAPHSAWNESAEREWEAECYKFSGCKGNSLEILLKVSSAWKIKDSSPPIPPKQKQKQNSPHIVFRWFFLPLLNSHALILISLKFALPSALWLFKRSSLEPFRLLSFCVWHEMAIQAVLVCQRQKGQQKLSGLSYLSPLPGLIRKKKKKKSKWVV